MTRSAPMDRTMSTFLVLHTPVASAPNHLAICTASVPTPPAAPLIKTFWPGLICPLSRRPCNAVKTATGTEAACSNVMFSGFTTNADSEVHTYSAKAPRQLPNTSSPGLNCVTFLPTASTSPATSTPSRVIFGLRSPAAMRTRYGTPLMKCQSSGLTEAARTFIRTSSSPATGFSISSHWRTAGAPYWWKTMAFTLNLLLSTKPSSTVLVEDNGLHFESPFVYKTVFRRPRPPSLPVTNLPLPCRVGRVNQQQQRHGQQAGDG